jgi:hypothetical protein
MFLNFYRVYRLSLPAGGGFRSRRAIVSLLVCEWAKGVDVNARNDNSVPVIAVHRLRLGGKSQGSSEQRGSQRKDQACRCCRGPSALDGCPCSHILAVCGVYMPDVARNIARFRCSLGPRASPSSLADQSAHTTSPTIRRLTCLRLRSVSICCRTPMPHIVPRPPHKKTLKLAFVHCLRSVVHAAACHRH